MINRRGCFTATYHEGYIYAFGGLNYTEKVMKKCERFKLVGAGEAGENKVVWQPIASLNCCRKNASSLSLTSDTLYVFGGASNQAPSQDTIEQYSVTSNKWNVLKVKMPKALAFMTTFKVSSSKVLIIGGCTRESS